MAEATPALEIRDLHKRYGDLEVLKGISLTARDGDVISILGSSGSGKSTFLRCINLLENPHKGQIIVAGEELKLKAAKNGDLVAADVPGLLPESVVQKTLAMFRDQNAAALAQAETDYENLIKKGVV